MRHVTLSRARDAVLPIAAGMRPRRWERTEDTVLILQPDHLGDIVLSQPAVRYLRERHPNSRLVAVVGPWSREITAIAWPVDEIVTVAFPGFTRTESESRIAPYRQLLHESSRLRRLRARTAYVLRPDAWWAAWLASITVPEVITADDTRSRQFATHVVSLANDEHSTLRAQRIAAQGNLPTPIDPASSPITIPMLGEAAADAGRLVRDRGTTGPYLIIHPGSGAAVKEWSANRWQAVAASLSKEGYQVIVTGSPVEAETCNAIATSIPDIISLAGMTSIPVLIEVMRGADAVLGPDCGPLHLAVATGTPTVHLFGPSDPRRYGPWGDSTRHRVVSAGWNCPRCGDLSSSRDLMCGCMLAIQPSEVVSLARSVLSRS